MFVADETPTVFSAAEVAAAAGVRLRDVRSLAASGVIVPLDGRYFSTPEAVRAVECLKRGGTAERILFRPATTSRGAAGLRILASTALHALMFAMLIAIAGISAAHPQARVRQSEVNASRLVFLIARGPGGGGGGGGHHEEPPPAPAERKGVSALRSPVPIRRPPIRIDPPPVVREVAPPIRIEPRPPIVAPVIPVAADARERVGLPIALKGLPAISESRGPGAGDGVGTGRGTGLGAGTGAGIGLGSGGGTGGGPYRPGSDVTAPSIVREVKPNYTDEARRRSLEGDVDLEIIVRNDGMVGNVKVLQGLGSGLDERAIDAVRQWRFSPATRFGAPVDVVVEVSVEFRLR